MHTRKDFRAMSKTNPVVKAVSISFEPVAYTVILKSFRDIHSGRHLVLMNMALDKEWLPNLLGTIRAKAKTKALKNEAIEFAGCCYGKHFVRGKFSAKFIDILFRSLAAEIISAPKLT